MAAICWTQRGCIQLFQPIASLTYRIAHPSEVSQLSLDFNKNWFCALGSHLSDVFRDSHGTVLGTAHATEVSALECVLW